MPRAMDDDARGTGRRVALLSICIGRLAETRQAESLNDNRASQLAGLFGSGSLATGAAHRLALLAR